MTDLKEMMLYSPTYFCAIARADWIPELRTKDEDALAGTIGVAAGISAGTVAAILNHPVIPVSDLASIFDNENLPADKLQAILDDENLSIQRGQEIVDAMTNPGKIGTGGRRGYIGDDWSDNKLTNRDKTVERAPTFDKIFSYFRPEWTVDDSPSGLTITVENRRVKFSKSGSESGTGYIRISSSFTIGAWEWKYQYSTLGSTPGYDGFKFMMVDGSNSYYMGLAGETGYGDLRKVVGGTDSIILDCSLVQDTDEHLVKVTRDSDGNFEVFQDGVSKGTVTDIDITTCNYLSIESSDYRLALDYYVDSLKVY